IKFYHFICVCQGNGGFSFRLRLFFPFYPLLDSETGFKKETVSKLLSSFFKEDKTRLSGDAVLLMTEMLKIFVQEAAVRSQKQAESEDCDQVDIEHFEKILPQLLLDF
uniref:Centromere protein X n=1 Tax=Gasterosteus aculeatus aculeatus TaxID=481459 RepID=G3PAR2_GASAC